MQAKWNSEGEDTILVSLDAGERLGNQIGPASFSIPAIAGNTDYAALLESGAPIENPA